jgi:hypothetical protein
MDKKYTSLENKIRNVVRGTTGAAQDNRSLESKIRSVVLNEGMAGYTAASERTEDGHRAVVKDSKGQTRYAGSSVYPTKRHAINGANVYIRNGGGQDGSDMERDYNKQVMFQTHVEEVGLDDVEFLHHDAESLDDLRRKLSAKARQAPPTAPEPEKKFSYTDGKSVTSTEAEMKDAARKAFMNRAVAAISSGMKGLEEGSEKFAKIMARTAAARGEPITTDTTELEKKHAELLQTSRDAADRAKKAREDYENLARQYGIPVEESAGSSLGDRAIDTALDIAPFIGTYRDYKRGNYGMAALGAAMDAATLFSLGAGTPANLAARTALRGGAKLAAGAEARALAGSEARAATRTSSRGTAEPVKGKTGKNSNERKRSEAESRLDAVTSGIGGSGGSSMPMPTLKASSQPSAMVSNNPINVHRAGARKVYGQEIHYNEYSPAGNYIGEDADSERSAIENVARPNSKNKLTKNAEIKTKIIEDTARRKAVILRAKEENKNGKDGGNSDVETKPELKRLDVNEQEITGSDVKTVAKGVLNFAVDSALNSVPGVAPARQAAEPKSDFRTRLKKGDNIGAGLSMASSVSSSFPGPGTAVSKGINAVSTVRDFINDNPSKGSAYGSSGMTGSRAYDQSNVKVGTPSQFPSK